MKARIFTLHLDPSTGRFDDSELLSFLEDREADLVSDHFFMDGGIPRLALVVTWREPPTRLPPQESNHQRSEPAGELAPEHRPLYDALRRWRNERSRTDGRPSYIYLTNRQMADIARLRPTTRSALQGIHGVGEGKVEQIGEEVLGIVAAFLAATP